MRNTSVSDSFVDIWCLPVFLGAQFERSVKKGAGCGILERNVEFYEYREPLDRVTHTLQMFHGNRGTPLFLSVYNSTPVAKKTINGIIPAHPGCVRCEEGKIKSAEETIITFWSELLPLRLGSEVFSAMCKGVMV